MKGQTSRWMKCLRSMRFHVNIIAFAYSLFWTLHNGMIFSTLNISSHGFALKGLKPKNIYPWSFPKLVDSSSNTSLEQSTPPLNRGSTPFLLESFVRHLRYPQWYDIVHFKHKLSWLCFGLPQKSSTNGESILCL